MKRCTHVLMIAALVTGLLLAHMPASAQQPITLRLGHNNAVTHPVNLATEDFAKRVRERSNGQLQIQVYPAAQLGDERQLGEAIQVGTVDIMYGQTSMLGRFVPEFNGLEGGYLFRDKEHMFKVMQGPIGKELNEKMIKGLNVRILTYSFAGERHLTTTKKQVNAPADLKGLLLRVPQIESSIATWQALGASTVGIAFNETYMGLKMGVAEGQENPIASIYAMKFHEVQKYLMFTSHVIACGIWSISERKFQSLPPNLQQILLEEAPKSAALKDQLFVKQEQEFLPELKKTMTFVDVDKAAFQKAAIAGGLGDWFVKYLGKDLYQRIVDTR